MRDHIKPRFVSCRNATGFALTLVVTYSETDSVKFKICKLIMLESYMENLCEVIAEDKKLRYCEDLFHDGQFCCS